MHKRQLALLTYNCYLLMTNSKLKETIFTVPQYENQKWKLHALSKKI